MTLRDQLLQAIDQIPEPLLSQVLDFTLFIKHRHSGDSVTLEVEQRETSKAKVQTRKSRVKAFQGLFEQTEPVPDDFDEDTAKWEALKEKYHL
ncbi:hypothetical protein [Roseofilum capinflatum]|uniref:DUF2281 domain-containing protein n=1 Tax=Roseofilum capinflatum BLCC-M114 TaxID=3022440 RepID=A0ABT7BBD2_9CYAN|nr:hypothetical protein [Roseofilum capinflatum]MDJ1176488.1 hypothetical protein [Roseofilum capinflatum BLCC-M114]